MLKWVSETYVGELSKNIGKYLPTCQYLYLQMYAHKCHLVLLALLASTFLKCHCLGEHRQA